MNTFQDIRNLEDDWDGYGVRKFSEELISFAEEVYKRLFKKPLIFPTARNSINLEYIDIECEIEIFDNIVVILMENNEIEIKKDVNLIIDTVNRLLLN